MNRHNEVQAGEDRRKAEDEDAHPRRHDMCIQIVGGERSSEGPTGINAAQHHRRENDNAANPIQVPAQQVDLRKSQILRSEEHTSELQSPYELVCRLLREKK